MNNTTEQVNIMTLPTIAMRGLLVFPQMTFSIDVERSSSVQAADLAASGDHLVFLCMQKNLEDDEPKIEDIYQVGTVCRVRQMLRQINQGYSRLIVEGLYRAEAVSMEEKDGVYFAAVRERPDRRERISEVRREAAVRSCLDAFHEYLELTRDIPSAQILPILANPNSNYIAFFIAQNLQINPNDKQAVLECDYPTKRFTLLYRLLRSEVQVLKIEQELSNQAQEQMAENQREYFLREELRAI